MTLNELAAQAALAHAGLANDPDHLSAALAGVLQGSFENPHLLVPSDETREPSSPGNVKPSARLPDSGELVYGDRMAHALDVELAELLDREVALDKRRCIPR